MTDHPGSSRGEDGGQWGPPPGHTQSGRGHPGEQGEQRPERWDQPHQGWQQPQQGWEQPPQGWQQPQQGWQQPQQPPQQAWEQPQQGWAQAPPGWGAPPGPPAPPKPGVIALRPLGIGEILDGSISTLRAHPKAMLGLSLAVAIITQLLTVPATWLLLRDSGDLLATDPETAPPAMDETVSFIANVMSAGALSVVVTMTAVLFLTGVLTVIVSRAVLGQQISLGEAWRLARPRIPALFGVTFLVLLIGLGLVAAAVVPIGLLLAAAGDGGGAAVVAAAFLGIVALPAVVVAGIYLYVCFSLAPAAVVLERQSVVAALRRSRALVKGAWWRTFWILLLVNFLAGLMGFFLSIPFSVGSAVSGALSGEGNMFGLVPMVIGSLGSIASSAITWPFTAAATVLIYVDRRIRREGLDLELARAATAPAEGTAGWSGPAGAPAGSTFDA